MSLVERKYMGEHSNADEEILQRMRRDREETQRYNKAKSDHNSAKENKQVGDSMKKLLSFALVIIIAVLGVLFYQSYDASRDIAANLSAFVSEVVSGRVLDRVRAWFPPSASPLGTRDNPYDWSTPERQIANAYIPSGSFVRTSTGNVRVAKDSEIAWAQDQARAKGIIIDEPSPPINPATVDVSGTIARFTVDRSSRLYPNVIDYDALYNTPLEKYIPDMEELYQEIQNTEGVQWQTMRAQYANGGKMVQFVLHRKLLPGWHNDDGQNEYDYVCFTWPSGDLSKYGSYQKYRTREFQDKLSFDSKKRLSTDNAYAQVVTVALQICDTTDYNWAGYSAYKGAKPQPTPGMTLSVCEGYAKAGQSAFLKLDCVKSVENWSTSSHEWNVLNLTDGRKLYVDITWFDNDSIDEKTGKTTYADDYGWENITFDEELFNHGQIAYSGGFTHASSSKKLESRVSR